MYCEKCKHQSPDNFTNCAYCGEKLVTLKEKTKTAEKVERKFMLINKKSAVITAVTAVAIISVISIIVGIVSGKKPQSVIHNMTKAITENDEDMYFSLFDGEYLEYKKECIYFTDDELLKGITEPMYETDEFYKKECGDDYKIKCRFDSVSDVDEKGIKKINDYLTEMYGYKKSVTDAAVLNFSVIAKGEKGKYESVYRDFYCIKIGGKWYRSPEIK